MTNTTLLPTLTDDELEVWDLDDDWDGDCGVDGDDLDDEEREDAFDLPVDMDPDEVDDDEDDE